MKVCASQRCYSEKAGQSLIGFQQQGFVVPIPGSAGGFVFIPGPRIEDQVLLGAGIQGNMQWILTFCSDAAHIMSVPGPFSKPSHMSRPGADAVWTPLCSRLRLQVLWFQLEIYIPPPVPFIREMYPGKELELFAPLSPPSSEIFDFEIQQLNILSTKIFH